MYVHKSYIYIYIYVCVYIYIYIYRYSFSFKQRVVYAPSSEDGADVHVDQVA